MVYIVKIMYTGVHKKVYADQRSHFWHAKMILCLELNLSVQAVTGTAVHKHRICDKLAIACVGLMDLIE